METRHQPRGETRMNTTYETYEIKAPLLHKSNNNRLLLNLLNC